MKRVLDKLLNTETGKAGLFLFVVGIIGLIVVFSVPWIEIDNDDKETYKYKDFDDDLKDDVGRDLDEYLHGSARLSLFGFSALLLAGIVLSLQAFNGKVYDVLSPHLPAPLRSNPRHPEFLKILLAFILVIFTLIIIISGTRFIGFSNSFEEFAEANGDSDLEMKSTAGWVVLIMGVILMALEIYYLYTTLSPKLVNDKNTYRKKLHTYVSFLTLFCLVGLIFFSLFPVITLEITNDDDEESHYNDGFVHWLAEITWPGSAFDDYEDVDSDLGWMRSFLWAGFFVGIITQLGFVYSYYSGDDHSGRFHLTASLGTFILIFGILFLIAHALLFSNINDIDEKNDEYNYEFDASFGWNYIPLLSGLGLVGLGVLYTKEAYPVSVQKIIGMKLAEKK